MTNENKTLFQEFKAPLIAIVSMTDVLKQTELSDEQRAFTRNIEESANSLLRLVNDVIENRIQDDTQLPPESFAEVVTELRDLVANQANSAPKANSLKPADIRVLIVEDNPLLQLVIMKQLAHLGIRAEAVADGETACRVAKDFDLIFMDCRLPVLDGFEATMAIRRDEDGQKRKRIVALTAGYEDKTREKCLDSGMDDCLIKPVGSQALRQVIERWFQLETA